MRPETTEWLRQSEYDIGTAEAMYSTGRYVYTAFMCRLAVEKALLFGSQARGNARKDSDFDLIVISPDFTKMASWRRWEVLGKAAARVMEPIEALAYSPEEVDDALQREGNFLRHILTEETIVSF